MTTVRRPLKLNKDPGRFCRKMDVKKKSRYQMAPDSTGKEPSGAEGLVKPAAAENQRIHFHLMMHTLNAHLVSSNI